MFESLFSAASDSSIAPLEAGICLISAVVLGLIIAASYMIVSKKEGYSREFIVGLVLLPAIVAVVIMLIGSNVARAFSMAGAFALVRFRSAPGSAKDIAVVFLSMAAGLACGLGLVGYAVVAVVVIVAVLVILSKVGFGVYKTTKKQLKITIPENLNYAGVFDEIFAKYGMEAELFNVKTTNMGTLYELTYRVDMPAGTDEKALIDDIRVRNANLNISLGMIPSNAGNGMLN